MDLSYQPAFQKGVKYRTLFPSAVQVPSKWYPVNLKNKWGKKKSPSLRLALLYAIQGRSWLHSLCLRRFIRLIYHQTGLSPPRSQSNEGLLLNGKLGAVKRRLLTAEELCGLINILSSSLSLIKRARSCTKVTFSESGFQKLEASTISATFMRT